MDHDLVAGLPLGHALADLPDDAGGVGAADVVAELLVVAVAEDRDRLAERRPDVVEVDARGHHPHDHLEGAGLRHVDLLDLEGVGRLALALLPDHPGGHLLGQLPGLHVELRNVCDLYCQVDSLRRLRTAGIVDNRGLAAVAGLGRPRRALAGEAARQARRDLQLMAGQSSSRTSPSSRAGGSIAFSETRPKLLEPPQLTVPACFATEPAAVVEALSRGIQGLADTERTARETSRSTVQLDGRSRAIASSARRRARRAARARAPEGGQEPARTVVNAIEIGAGSSTARTPRPRSTSCARSSSADAGQLAERLKQTPESGGRAARERISCSFDGEPTDSVQWESARSPRRASLVSASLLVASFSALMESMKPLERNSSRRRRPGR